MAKKKRKMGNKALVEIVSKYYNEKMSESILDFVMTLGIDPKTGTGDIRTVFVSLAHAVASVCEFMCTLKDGEPATCNELGEYFSHLLQVFCEIKDQIKWEE